MALLVKARHSRQGKARPEKARQGKAEQGKASLVNVKQVKSRRGYEWQCVLGKAICG
jgi:hypothetical protein